MRSRLASHLFPFILSLLFVGISTSVAHAYLDAGTGSLILQVLLGGLAGLAVAGKLYWHRLLVFLGIRHPVPAAGAEEEMSTDRGRTDK